jgi:hypothetical protein
MGLFKRKDMEKPQKNGSSDGGAVLWCTNAPGHWPAIHCEPLDPEGNQMRNELIMAAAINTSFGKDGPLKLMALARSYMGQKGILHVGIEVEDHGKKVPVFVYPRADTDAANHFYAVYEFFKQRGMAPVYYAPEVLPNATEEVDPFLGFSMLFIDQNKEYDSSSGHATWWATDEDPDFLRSNAFTSIDRAKRAMDGIETYVLAALLKGAGYIEDDEILRAGLPDETAFFPMNGPEEIPMILTVSREKGLAIAFPEEQAGTWYRDLFLYHFADYCQQWRSQIENAGARMEDFHDDSGEGSPLDHWKMVIGSFQMLSKEGKQIQSFNPIFTH